MLAAFVSLPVHLVVRPLGLVMKEHERLDVGFERELDGIVIRGMAPAVMMPVFLGGKHRVVHQHARAMDESDQVAPPRRRAGVGRGGTQLVVRDVDEAAVLPI